MLLPAHRHHKPGRAGFTAALAPQCLVTSQTSQLSALQIWAMTPASGACLSEGALVLEDGWLGSNPTFTS